MGTILEGKITGITKFGAFVTIAPGKSGLVHISEIANTYVNNVSDHLSEGQDVKVKIIGVDQSGRINLSIKAATPINATSTQPPHNHMQSKSGHRSGQNPSQRPHQKSQEPASEPTFEDRLKRFMQDSDNKMSGLKHYSDKKGGKRRGK